MSTKPQAHSQPDIYRKGFFGPWAIVFTTDGSVPQASSYNLTFFEELGISSYVGSTGRGTISGTASNITPEFNFTVGLANEQAQVSAIKYAYINDF